MTKHGDRMRYIQDALLEETDACILWPYSKTGKYGACRFEGKSAYAHRTVCILAHGKPPSRHHQAAHTCGAHDCINKRHLRWATPKQNKADQLMHGTDNRGEKHNLNKLTETEVYSIRASKEKGVVLAHQYGVSTATISLVRNRKNWQHLN